MMYPGLTALSFKNDPKGPAPDTELEDMTVALDPFRVFVVTAARRYKISWCLT